MEEKMTSSACPVCGVPSHIGCEHTAAAQEKAALTRIDSPKDEYGSMDDMFQIERLSENFDEVADQLENLRYLIEKYNDIDEQSKTDEGLMDNIDGAQGKIDDAFYNFKIGDKQMDISKLIREDAVNNEEKFNDIVICVNDYISSFMIGKRKKLINGI